MPPRIRKKKTTCAKSERRRSGTSRTRSKRSAPSETASTSSPSTSNALPSTSRNVSSSARSTPSRTMVTRSAYKSIPSTSTSRKKTSSSVSVSSTPRSAPSGSRSHRASSKPTCATQKSYSSTLNPMPSTSKSSPSKLRSESGINSLPSTSTPEQIYKPKMISSTPPPRSVSFMRLLQQRELGLGYAHRFSEVAFQLKLGDFEIARSHRFGNSEEVLHTIYFLRPGKNALVGAWYVQMRNTYKNMFTTAIAQLHYDLSRVAPGKTRYIVSENRIVDACQVHVNPDCFACVTSPPKRYEGQLIIASTTLHDITPRSQVYNGYYTYSYCHPNNKTFWCCNSNLYTEKIAVGCDQEVCIYSVTGIEDVRYVRGNVYSVAYNNNGTVLHMGSETGEFLLLDLRSNDVGARVKVDRQLLDDILMLSDENYCIVSGVSGCLCKIDFRMQKIVVKYPHHDRRSRRIPVSVNETFGLLSSSGADDTTRIWSLNSGQLLHSFKPPSTYPARSCFVPDSPRAMIHLVQDSYVHVYSMQS